MTERFSVNGDGKKRPPSNRISPVDGQRSVHPNNPEPEREKQIIEALKVRYDEIEALWTQAEEDLKRFRVPYGVDHCYDSDYDGGCPTHYVLWWVRHGKAWRICHEVRWAHSEIDEKHHDENDLKPITECPLDLRLRMISEFEHLRKKVVEAAENAVPTLDEAISNFRKVLKS
jgi:hypothetical protein